MQLFFSFLRLIRWPNLIFIILAQGIFYFFIEFPLYAPHSVFPILDLSYFILLCLSSICIAAAGYIINDYFDVNIDMINKPHKLIIEKDIKRRWAIAWHLILSIFGIVIGFYIDYKTPISFIGLTNIGCAVLLFLYSVSLKRKLISGNVVISILTAWSICIVPFAEWNALSQSLSLQIVYKEINFNKLYLITFLYSGFAFIISIIREAVKDMEDVEGDMQYNCYTMPIVWGIRTAKVYAAVWMVVLISGLVIMQLYAWHLGWKWLIIYCLVTTILPLCFTFNKLIVAKKSSDFHSISTLIKLIMFTGILSMLLFKL